MSFEKATPRVKGKASGEIPENWVSSNLGILHETKHLEAERTEKSASRKSK